MRSQARYSATLILALSVLSVPAQLNKWLARDLNGVYVVDMSTPRRPWGLSFPARFGRYGGCEHDDRCGEQYPVLHGGGCGEHDQRL
jgi:hypothetical protein